MLPEEGSLPKAEKPSSYHRGQTGKGVRVGGGHIRNPFSRLTINDPWIRKKVKEFKKAIGAATRFRSRIG